MTFSFNHSLTLGAYRSISVPFPFCSGREDMRGLRPDIERFYRRSQILSPFFSLQCTHAQSELKWVPACFPSSQMVIMSLPPGCSPRIEKTVSGWLLKQRSHRGISSSLLFLPCWDDLFHSHSVLSFCSLRHSSASGACSPPSFHGELH